MPYFDFTGKERRYDPKKQAQGINFKVAKTYVTETDKEKADGMFHKKFANDPFPEFDDAEDEKVIRGENNTWIVMGRDRPTTKESGYGSANIPRAGTIDLVVGRGGSTPRKVNENNQQLYVDNNFTHDSARIYVSQKTDVDQNFFLSSGRNSPDSLEKAAIALKADAVRLIGRENIKIVTGTDLNNSNGKMPDGNFSISLIGGNDSSNVQPMVKGDNLVELLGKVIKYVIALNGQVSEFLTLQHEINLMLAGHTHISPFEYKPTSKSPNLVTMPMNCNYMLTNIKSALVANVANFKTIELNYINRPDDHAKNILSSYNFCN